MALQILQSNSGAVVVVVALVDLLLRVELVAVVAMSTSQSMLLLAKH